MRRKRRKSPFLTPVVFVLAAILAAGVGGAIAKYVSSEETPAQQVVADDFYFTSSLLGEDVSIRPEYTLYCKDLNSASLLFDLSRVQDGLNKTTDTVSYLIRYKASNQQNYSDLPGNRQLTGDAAAEISVPLSDMTALGISQGMTQITIDIIVQSTFPYEKELYGRFTVRENARAASFSITEGSNEFNLILTVGSDGGTVNITAPAGCVSNPINNLSRSGQTYSLTVPANSSYSFVFLKTGSYAGGSFYCTLNGNEVPAA